MLILNDIKEKAANSNTHVVQAVLSGTAIPDIIHSVDLQANTYSTEHSPGFGIEELTGTGYPDGTKQPGYGIRNS